MDHMAAIKMTVFKPERRDYYIMRWTDPVSHKRREKSTGKAVKREAYKVAVEFARKIAEGDSPENDSENGREKTQ